VSDGKSNLHRIIRSRIIVKILGPLLLCPKCQPWEGHRSLSPPKVCGLARLSGWQALHLEYGHTRAVMALRAHFGNWWVCLLVDTTLDIEDGEEVRCPVVHGGAPNNCLMYYVTFKCPPHLNSLQM
jgi:hypothetical protein